MRGEGPRETAVGRGEGEGGVGLLINVLIEVSESHLTERNRMQTDARNPEWSEGPYHVSLCVRMADARASRRPFPDSESCQSKTFARN